MMDRRTATGCASTGTGSGPQRGSSVPVERQASSVITSLGVAPAATAPGRCFRASRPAQERPRAAQDPCVVRSGLRIARRAHPFHPAARRIIPIATPCPRGLARWPFPKIALWHPLSPRRGLVLRATSRQNPFIIRSGLRTSCKDITALTYRGRTPQEGRTRPVA